MGFLDKVKATAQEVAQDAKKAAGQAQAKLEVAQLKRKRDEAAKQLGYLVYRERPQELELGPEAAALVAEIASLEAQIAAHESGARADGEPPPAQDAEPPA
jgi:septal ring factor EnvC (AmiA/AmiB activator)